MESRFGSVVHLQEVPLSGHSAWAQFKCDDRIGNEAKVLFPFPHAKEPNCGSRLIRSFLARAAANETAGVEPLSLCYSKYI